ncbi:MAG TPA: hypothetical protein VN915_13500 [Elusimicrobiota bacterium]|nr:hypothetical protein [Elusimicrobiota bacterium]
MRIGILADAGRTAGLGHLTRCLALAQAVETIHGRKPIFLDLDTASRRWVEERGFPCRRGWRGPWDLLIVDSYRLSKKDYASARRGADRVLLIHDAGTLRSPADWLLNSAVYAKEVRYGKADVGGMLLGPIFQPLRREFWRPAPLRLNRRVRNVLVTLGGGDIQRPLAIVLPSLQTALPEAHFHVVVGPHAQTPPGAPREGVDVHRSPRDIRRIARSCDIAVSAGGQTLYELASMGIPVVALEIAGNQRPNIAGFVSSGAALSAGRVEAPGFKKTFRKKLRILADDRGLRAALARAGRRMIDGQGALRTIRAISLSGREGKTAC